MSRRLDQNDLKMDFDPQKARTLRVKQRLKNDVNFDADDDDDDNVEFSKHELKNIEKKYKEDDELGEDEIKKKDYFGIQIEPFNMKKDRDKGKIHEDGYFEFTRKNDPDELKDAWLDSIEDNPDTVKKTKKRKAKQDLEAEKDDKTTIKLSEKELFHLKKELFDMLLPNENSTHALNRLRPSAQAKTAHKKNVRKKVKTDEEAQEESKHEDGTKSKKEEGVVSKAKELTEEEKKRRFNRIIEICDQLVSTGYSEIYTDTKEQIEEKFMKEEDRAIRKDLDELEKDLYDMNQDHNVIEQ